MKGAIELEDGEKTGAVASTANVSYRFNVEIFRLLAYLSFWLMVILAIIITTASNAVPDMNNTSLTKVLGYNNICVYWDYEPSRSFIALFYPIVEGFLCLYFLGHFFRCQIAFHSQQMTQIERNFQMVLSFFTIVFGVWFRMIFVEHMDDDAKDPEQRGHVAGFLCLQICMILLETQNYFYLRVTWEHGKHWVGPLAYLVYLTICGIKLILGIGVTVARPLLDIHDAGEITFARTMDVLWMVVNAICPIFFSYYWLTHTKHTFVISFQQVPKKTEGASLFARRVFAVCIAVFAVMGLVAVYSALVSEDSTSVEPPKVVVPPHLQLVYPKLHLPVDSIFQDAAVLDARMNGTTVGNPALMFIGPLALSANASVPSFLGSQLGQPKVQALNTLNAVWINKLSPNASLRATPPFGPDALMNVSNEVDTLSALEITIATLLRTNSFYTSALSNCNGVACVTTSGNGLFAAIIGNMNTTYERVDASFDGDLMIQNFTVSNAQGAVQASRLHAYKVLAFLLNYHSECLHASLHSAQYLLASALVHASDTSFSMATFARTYTWNIRRSYDAVVSLDLGYKQADNAVLVGGTIGASRDGLLATMEQIILNMTAGPTAEAFVENFLLAGLGPELASKHGVLQEFRNQARLLDGYSTEIQNALDQTDFGLETMESRLKWYCDEIGFFKNSKASVTKFKSWIETQAVLAIMHTNTLSFTRFMATIAALEVSSPQDSFTMWELVYWRATAPTVIGVEAGFHLFGQAPFDYNWKTLPRPSQPTNPQLIQMTWSAAYPRISAVLQKYESLSAAASLEAHRFSKASGMDGLEWLTADFFENGFDGRQITFTTYF